MDNHNEVKGKEKDKDLERARSEIRTVTAEIVRLVQKRMELSKQVGELKSRMNLEVKDERVEHEIRNMVLKLSKDIGMSPDFAGRLLNVLLMESVRLQQTTQGSAPRQTHMGIFLKAKQLEASGKKIIHMEVGEPDFPPPGFVGDALVEAYKSGKHHYTETRGVRPLREALAKKSGKVFTEENVIVTVGGRFAVYCAITSLLKAGEELIMIEPSWPAYRECAESIGAKAALLRTRFEDGWNPDITQLEELVNSSTKMIVLNYPNNPTGKILDKKTMDGIVSLARKNDIYVLSDEVYSDYAFSKFTSILDYGYDKSVMISSFSKSYAMTGFRIGYAIANKEVISKMAKIQAVALTSVAEPIQYSALAALRSSPSENVRQMKKRLDLVCKRLREMGLDFVVPDGAMYVYPYVKNEDMALVERLLEQGVAVAPGSGFGDAYRQFIRISACQPEATLQKGLDIIERSIKQT